MTDFIFHVIGDLAAHLRRRKWLRLSLLLASPVLGFILMIADSQMSRGEYANDRLMHQVLPPIIALCFATFALAILAFTNITFTTPSAVTAELDSIRREREELKSRLRSDQGNDTVSTPASVIRTIEINLNQLTEYYTINKAQAKSSFRVSVWALIAGLITIIAGIWFYYMDHTAGVSITYISTAAGIISEFIAASYFYMYNKSISQLNFFFQKLTDTQNTMLAITLCESLPEPEATQAKLGLIEQLMAVPSLARREPVESPVRPTPKKAPKNAPANGRPRSASTSKTPENSVPGPTGTS